MSRRFERWFVPPHWLVRGWSEGLHRLEQLINALTDCVEALLAGGAGALLLQPANAVGQNVAPTGTTVAAINTPVPVAGAMTVVPPLHLVTLDIPGLLWTYTGPASTVYPLEIRMEGSMRKLGGGPPQDYEFFIGHNGATPIGLRGPVTVHQNEYLHYRADARVFAATGDTFQLYVQNLTGDDDLETSHRLESIFGL